MFGGTWTDITAYVRNGTITRPGSRLQGPVWQYQAGTCQLTLVNTSGRFDPDNSSSPYWGGSATRTATFTATGTWTCPEGVTSLTSVQCLAGGGGGGNDPATGGGNDGGGGGGGEFASESTVAVTPLRSYVVTVGAGGAGGAGASSAQHNGTAGGNSSFPGDAVTVLANGGSGGTAGAGGGGGAGAGGTGSTNTTHHDGGAGAAGTTGHGGGGGSAAGPAAAGNAASGSTGGVAVTGGGPGGSGGTSTSQNGGTPANGPGGGGGGADSTTTNAKGGAGQSGQVVLTYSTATAETQVLPMVPIKIQATWNSVTYNLFTGYADSWADAGTNFAGRYGEVTLSATDAFKVFSGITLAELGSPVGAGEDAGARVSRILDAAGWSPSLRSITTGDTTLQATALGDTAMSLLQLAADSELGDLYVDGAGNLVFRHRLGKLTDSRSTTPQAVFGDIPGTVETDGTEIAYQLVPRASDDTTMVNDAQITAANGGTLQEAQDSDSVAKYLYPRTYARSDLLMQDDATALNYAEWVVYLGADAEDRFDTLTLMPRRDPSNMWPQALGRELGDRIQVWRRPPNVAAISKDVFIEGIAHTFDAPSQSWQTQWMLTSASKYGSFFVWDDAGLGVWDANAWAY
jgi:hypothetical protein